MVFRKKKRINTVFSFQIKRITLKNNILSSLVGSANGISFLVYAKSLAYLIFGKVYPPSHYLTFLKLRDHEKKNTTKKVSERNQDRI